MLKSFLYFLWFVFLTVVKEWEKRYIPGASGTIKKNTSILKYVCGLKHGIPCIKVFLQNESKKTKDAKDFFRTEGEKISKEMLYDFVCVKEASERILDKDEQIEKEERDAPEVPEATRDKMDEIICSEGEKIYAKYSIVVGIGISNILSKCPKENKQPCIVLYCLDTDLIPYGENPIPTIIHGYPCDVREEICMTMASCKDCKKLNPGCDIGCDMGKEISTGTAGFLINGNIRGFLTAAHVVQKVDQIYVHESDNMHTTTKKHKQITHPSDSSEVIGEVENYICGNYCTYGSDIAIVRSMPLIDEQQGNPRHIKK